MVEKSMGTTPGRKTNAESRSRLPASFNSTTPAVYSLLHLFSTRFNLFRPRTPPPLPRLHATPRQPRLVDVGGALLLHLHPMTPRPPHLAPAPRPPPPPPPPRHCLAHHLRRVHARRLGVHHLPHRLQHRRVQRHRLLRRALGIHLLQLLVHQRLLLRRRSEHHHLRGALSGARLRVRPTGQKRRALLLAVHTRATVGLALPPLQLSGPAHGPRRQRGPCRSL